MSTNISSPSQKSVRGFAFYVGLEADIEHPRLKALVDELNRVVNDLSPGAETQVSVALASSETRADSLNIVKRAAAQSSEAQHNTDSSAVRKTGVVVDFSRRQVLLDGFPTDLTFKEFEIFKFLVLREGVAVKREEILEFLATYEPSSSDAGARAIDVAIRRLRVKLQDYEQIISTVRGVGYRFDRHADVKIIYGQGPSPDRF